MTKLWVKKKLGEVCTLQRGFDPPKRQRIKGNYPLVSSSGYIDSHIQAKVSSPGIVTGRSGSIGSLCFIDEDFWPLNTTLYVKDFHGNDPKFIFYLLSKFDLKRFSGGAGVPTLNRNHVDSELVTIPTCIEEQKQILAILDEAFEGIDKAIENTEKNLANAREIFESYLNSIFINKGIDWSDLVYTSNQDEIDKYNFNYNDVLFNRTNRAEHVGKSAIYKGEIPDIFAGYLIRIHRKNELIDADFLNFYLNSSIARDYGRSVMSQSVNQANINVTKLKSYPISIPPLEKQIEITQKLNDLIPQIKILETLYKRKIEALKELKQWE